MLPVSGGRDGGCEASEFEAMVGEDFTMAGKVGGFEGRSFGGGVKEAG